MHLFFDFFSTLHAACLYFAELYLRTLVEYVKFQGEGLLLPCR